MKNKEIEELLNTMKDKECDYVGTNGCLYQDLERKELNLLLSYIEQLENNRDKAIEYMKNNSKISLDDSVSIIRFYKQLKIILEGDRNE